MKATISSETLLINDKEFTIINVSSSPGSFGICNTTRRKEKGLRETFYLGNEPLIHITQKSVNDPYSNKMICQVSSIERSGDFVKRVMAVRDDYFSNNKTLLGALQPLLDYIKNGLYVIYEEDMIPTDGSGNFFWSSYLVNHELSGSSTYNAACPADRVIPPAFLVPTENIANYSEAHIKLAAEKVKAEDGAYGICFHLSGMFCALLSNHHEVTAALMMNKKVRCLIIEPVKNLRFANDISSVQIDREENDESQPEEDYFYTACARIPLSKISQPFLESFFLTRRKDVSKYSDVVTYNSDKNTTLKGKRGISNEIIERCDKMPDAEMLQSVAMIDYISDEELDALLQGETMLNEKYIINQNYYSSITLAFNYLLYKDFGKFLNFSSSILMNEDLTAVHQYVASRLQPIIHKRIFDLFNSIIDSDNAVYVPIMPLAEKYITRYNLRLENEEKEKEKEKELKELNDVPIMKRNLENEINSLELAKKIQHAAPPKKK